MLDLSVESRQKLFTLLLFFSLFLFNINVIIFLESFPQQGFKEPFFILLISNNRHDFKKSKVGINTTKIRTKRKDF